MSECCVELALPLNQALWESWPWRQSRTGSTPSQLQYLRECPAHCWPWEYEHGRAGLSTHVLGGGVDKGEIAFSPPGDLALGVMTAGELALPLTWTAQYSCAGYGDCR